MLVGKFFSGVRERAGRAPSTTSRTPPLSTRAKTISWRLAVQSELRMNRPIEQERTEATERADLLRLVQSGDGARPSGRFHVQSCEPQKRPGLLAVCELKRRERRAPPRIKPRKRISRDSIILCFLRLLLFKKTATILFRLLQRTAGRRHRSARSLHHVFRKPVNRLGDGGACRDLRSPV